MPPPIPPPVPADPVAVAALPLQRLTRRFALAALAAVVALVLALVGGYRIVSENDLMRQGARANAALAELLLGHQGATTKWAFPGPLPAVLSVDVAASSSACSGEREGNSTSVSGSIFGLDVSSTTQGMTLQKSTRTATGRDTAGKFARCRARIYRSARWRCCIFTRWLGMRLPKPASLG